MNQPKSKDTRCKRGCGIAAVGLVFCLIALGCLCAAFAKYNNGFDEACCYPYDPDILKHGTYFEDESGQVVNKHEFRATLALHILALIGLVACFLMWAIVLCTEAYKPRNSAVNGGNLAIHMLALIFAIITASLMTQIFVKHRSDEVLESGSDPVEYETSDDPSNDDPFDDPFFNKKKDPFDDPFFNKPQNKDPFDDPFFHQPNSNFPRPPGWRNRRESEDDKQNYVSIIYIILLWSVVTILIIALAMAFAVLICVKRNQRPCCADVDDEFYEEISNPEPYPKQQSYPVQQQQPQLQQQNVYQPDQGYQYQPQIHEQQAMYPQQYPYPTHAEPYHPDANPNPPYPTDHNMQSHYQTGPGRNPNQKLPYPTAPQEPISNGQSSSSENGTGNGGAHQNNSTLKSTREKGENRGDQRRSAELR
ncbi:uncharacterized protein LOC142346164 [Convolutriloba macropyga]|uniref:uncharacterized protein LOC142346164 n=1 Tax=Convolutriloba macropyga TaxID=536237 RepID=UPI003F521793